jgi:hypothetical protein
MAIGTFSARGSLAEVKRVSGSWRQFDELHLLISRLWIKSNHNVNQPSFQNIGDDNCTCGAGVSRDGDPAVVGDVIERLASPA